jgi:hypothetical protein
VGRSTPLYVELVGPFGLVGPWAIVPAHRASSGRLISCRAGPALWVENEAQPSPTSCSCRPRPEKIVLGSCSCRAKKSCFGPTHGPRAKWPSISMDPPSYDFTIGPTFLCLLFYLVLSIAPPHTQILAPPLCETVEHLVPICSCLYEFIQYLKLLPSLLENRAFVPRSMFHLYRVVFTSGTNETSLVQIREAVSTRSREGTFVPDGE